MQWLMLHIRRGQLFWLVKKGTWERWSLLEFVFEAAAGPAPVGKTLMESEPMLLCTVRRLPIEPCLFASSPFGLKCKNKINVF
jgi:hypothetical protein